jgi:hypothetical protein
MSTAFNRFITLSPQEKIYPTPGKWHRQNRLWNSFTEKTNDKYSANIGSLYKFYYMSISNSMIVYCEARYLNTSRNLNQT